MFYLGGGVTESVKENINSWKKYNPDYTIMEWNESNFDILSNQYVKEAYRMRKWAFAADYIRLWALYHYGGIYMDIDVECIRAFDDLLKNKIVLGFEGDYYFSNAVMLCEKNSSLIKYFLDKYKDRKFILKTEKDGTLILDEFCGPQYNTCSFLEYYKIKRLKNGNYSTDEYTILEKDTFSPPIWGFSNHKDAVKEGISYTIHHFEGTWKTPILLTNWQRLIVKLKFIKTFKTLRLVGNAKFLKNEQKAYATARRYASKNLKKDRKNIRLW